MANPLIQALAGAYQDAFRSVVGRPCKAVSPAVLERHGDKVLETVMSSTADSPFDFFRFAIMESAGEKFRRPFHFCHGFQVERAVGEFLAQHGDVLGFYAETDALLAEMLTTPFDERAEFYRRREAGRLICGMMRSRFWPLAFDRLHDLPGLRSPKASDRNAAKRVPIDIERIFRRNISFLFMRGAQIERVSPRSWGWIRAALDTPEDELHNVRGAERKALERLRIVEDYDGSLGFSEPMRELGAALVKHAERFEAWQPA